jgi:3-hydroxyisobutyrate dehydrogenase
VAAIAFIGLGNMGLPMARNLIEGGHRLTVHDLAAPAVKAAVAAGAAAAANVAQALAGASHVITMLPEGRHVREVYLGPDGVIAHADAGSLLIDCSTIDVDTARLIAGAAETGGFDMLDAPVSGGVAGAERASLTFMVGGKEGALARARPLLEAMGRTIVHAGPPGNGQAAKICNNLMLGISMIGVCEAFVLARRLGLDAQTLFDISSRSSGQCWSLTSYCPVPGPVPAAPSNREYQAGFAAAMMSKDLRLAQDAARSAGVPCPLGASAQSLYALFEGLGQGHLDFSGIIKMIAGEL